MKVFSKVKFYADEKLSMRLRELSIRSGWPEMCDGKTEEECDRLGFGVLPDWMEEE